MNRQRWILDFGFRISDYNPGIQRRDLHARRLFGLNPKSEIQNPKSLAVLAATLLLFTGCSMIRQSMMGSVSSSLADSAALSFSRENDLELAAGAMPFALKTLDMLALQQPDNPEILLTAGRTYIQYSAAFLDWPARKLELDDFAAANHLRQRAAALYFRGRDYAAASLALRHPEALTHLKSEPDVFLAACDKSDVPALFWLASGWAAGLAADPANMHEFAYLGLIETIMHRCYELEPDFEDGSLHEFFLAYEATRSAASGGDSRLAEQHYDRAVTASAVRRVSPFVLFATTVMIQKQDATAYRDLLQRALDLDLDAAPDLRLANALAQDKARWYLDHIEEFFLLEESPEIK